MNLDPRHRCMSQILDMETYSHLYLQQLKKQDKFQPRDKSYLYNITNSEAEPLKDGSAASIANPKTAPFHYVATFCHTSFGNPSKLWLLAQIYFVHLMLFSVSKADVPQENARCRLKIILEMFQNSHEGGIFYSLSLYTRIWNDNQCAGDSYCS